MTGIIEIITGSWELITLVGVGVGSLVRWLWKSKLDKRTAKAVSNKEVKESNVAGDTALFAAINEMKLLIATLQKQSIDQGSVITTLHKEINKYKAALNKLTLLCDVMCADRDTCKDKIVEVMEELGLKHIENSTENAEG